MQSNYNNQHSKERSVIERAFSLLKCKWRKLKYLDVTNLAFFPDIIACAVILHNFILEIEGEDDDDDSVESDSDCDDDFDDDLENGGNEEAYRKRDQIAQSL